MVAYSWGLVVSVLSSDLISDENTKEQEGDGDGCVDEKGEVCKID